MKIEDVLGFIKEADKLKQVERQTLIHNGGRKENSAEHSWHLAIAALVLQSFAPEKLDINKAIKMALLHDIVEIDAGDTIVYGDLSGKEDAEAAALVRLMALLPNESSSDLKLIWLEFEEGRSPEAKYISAIDRFLPIYSNYLNEGHSWKNHNITVDRIIAKCEKPISTGIPALWELTKKMLAESIANGNLAK